MPGDHDQRTDALLASATYADGDALQAVLADLRGSPGLAWNATEGFWAVTRHADVQAISTDSATFCSGRGILVQEIGQTYDSPPTMMHTDPPAHTRYRSLVTPGFKPSVTRSLEPRVRAMGSELLDALPTGSEVDVVDALAVPFPIRVIAAILGLPQEREHDLWEWSEAAIPGATDWPQEKIGALMGDMVNTLLGLAADRRRAPAGMVGSGIDVVSMLAAVELDGEQLREDELGMFLIQLLVAGNETTRHAISGSVVALAERPDQWSRLQADRSLIATAAEEVLRWTTPVTSFMRTATRDTELAGTAIAEGDPVLLLYASADRDEAAFGPTADQFDVGRSPNPHLAFGFGHHFCLGAALARLEIAVVLEGMLDRFAGVEMAGPVERTGSSVIAGIRHAPVRFTRVTKVDDVGEVDGWRCWLCDDAVDPAMSVEDDRGPSIDTCHPKEKGPRRVAGPERLAHRGCNTRKGQVSPEVPWPDDLFAVDPAPILVVLDRLGRKGGREVVARCPTAEDGEALATWLTDRVSRLVPDLPVEASVASGGSQFVVALTVPRR